jgi:hypothetical protein
MTHPSKMRTRIYTPVMELSPSSHSWNGQLLLQLRLANSNTFCRVIIDAFQRRKFADTEANLHGK